MQKQYIETQAKYQSVEDKLEQSEKTCEEAKRGREEVYEKFLHAREVYKVEYEQKMNAELAELKVRTSGEIEKLRASTNEFYEREIAGLREARDQVLQDKVCFHF